jgi:predicted DNA repair protein MutK
MSIWILALLDDIAILADDAAVMTKISIQKTAWILWDDLAVNAEKASGFDSSRELPVLWKITKWALLNKIMILPFAFLLSYFAPVWVIPAILVFGWFYLAFEWTEKIHEFLEHKIMWKKHDNDLEIKMWEEEKVKSAIFTDFILSIEIIILALSTVLEKSLTIQIIVVSIVAIIATVWVYWIVTLLVRTDDLWFYLMWKSSEGKLKYKLWNALVKSLPFMIKGLWIIWTWAMLLVAGWIFTHNISFIHHIYESVNYIPSIIFDTILWFIAGYILVIIFFLGKKLLKKLKNIL